MRLRAEILTEEERVRVHQDSLRVLQEVGIRFHSEKALRLLDSHGARVDWEERIARIPEEMVNQALNTTPKTLVLGARNPEFDFPMPSPVTRYGLDGTAAFAVDFETGERRYGTRKDIENGVRLFRHADMGITTWPPTCASDAPANSRVLHEFFTVLRYCSKHAEHELHRVEEVPYFVAGLRAILGSEDAVKERKIASVTYCTLAPLAHDGPMCDAYFELGRYHVPITILPMPVSGTTGPASLYSNVTLANAEALSAVVIFQLENPGSPLIYSCAAGSADFTSGAFMSGTPESGLMSPAIIEMAKHYNLPNTSTGCLSDAKQPGPEAVIEKVITALPSVLVGADLIVGFGEIEASQALVLEQVLVDNEIAHLCQRLRDGIDTCDGKDLYADIARVGPGGHFLGSKSTRAATRSGEFYTPRLIDRSSYEAWVNLGSPTLYAKAREKVEEILARPVMDALPDEVSEGLDRILLAADKELPE
jgi:trimethylamine--corrinoid protein Co-methyltransferase